MLHPSRQPLYPQTLPARQGFDEDGFLIDSTLWSEELARTLARMEGLGQLYAEH